MTINKAMSLRSPYRYDAKGQTINYGSQGSKVLGGTGALYLAIPPYRETPKFGDPPYSVL